MTDADYATLIEALLPVVESVADLQVRYRREGVAVVSKKDLSPVTVADQESEALIMAALEAAMPGVPVVGEEAVSDGIVPEPGPRFFLVDPLDGTREYVANKDDFTINVALVEAGVPVFGIVAAPALGEIFVTTAADAVVVGRIGADISAGGIQRIAPHPIATVEPDRNRLRVIASRSHTSAELDRHLERIGFAERLAVGSSLKFCRVAQGQADVYPRIGEISEWDTAAGHAVVLAAGGAMTTLCGQPILYGKKAAGFRQPSFVVWGKESLSAQISFAPGERG